jgi:hypothetical protein
MRFFTHSAQRARKNHTVMHRRVYRVALLRTASSFNRTVVLRHRFFLEQKNLAPSTINVRLAAVRRLAYEASDTGLLSPDLAAGIRRVKGAKRLGVRIGNWLTIDQSRTLLGKPSDSLRSTRDQADSGTADRMRPPTGGTSGTQDGRLSGTRRSLLDC